MCYDKSGQLDYKNNAECEYTKTVGQEIIIQYTAEVWPNK